MASIVGIHGMSQQYHGRSELTAVWLTGLKDGLSAAGRDDLARDLSEEDVSVAFFGDLFRPPGAMAGGDPVVDVGDLTSPVEVGLLTTFYEAAVAEDPSLGPDDGAMGLRAAKNVMLERLLRTKTFGAVAKLRMTGNLHQVSLFLDDNEVKEDVLDRVHGTLTSDTRVLIGHSLGTVVAYEYLCRYSPPDIEALITIGAPIGIQTLIFERLTPPPVDGRGTWPGAVARWINVADRNDIVTMQCRLAPMFAPGPKGQSVEDRSVDNGELPHAIERYLNSGVTGGALADVIG